MQKNHTLPSFCEKGLYIKVSTAALIFFCLAGFSLKTIYASDYVTDTEVTYDIAKDGTAKVTYDIQVENTSENSLSQGYILKLSHITPSDIVVSEDGNISSPELSSNDDDTTIILRFLKPIIGKGKKKNIEVSFKTDSIAQKSGEIWDIALPKVTPDLELRDYNVSLNIPLEFGEEAFMVPRQIETRKENEKQIYIFNKDQITTTAIHATFGKFQIFSFNLTYHLENNSFTFAKEEIAIPPNTSIQEVYLQEINPKPRGFRVDNDGNWLLEYRLFPWQKKEIHVHGFVQVFASPRKLAKPENLNENTKATTYWQTEDKKVQNLATEFKTTEKIYRYVVNTLSYDYSRVDYSRIGEESSRLGAVKTLQNPSKALCREFTDLFITLSRAAGIPTREVNGFAYSDNTKVQPLSLISDVLHSWPEYWDRERELWIPVDPTWEQTTGGQDFFSTFDLRHVAFVIHGQDDTKPYPAGSYNSKDNPQKDVFVTPSSLSEDSVPLSQESLEKFINKPKLPVLQFITIVVSVLVNIFK